MVIGALALSGAAFLAGYYSCKSSLTEKTSKKAVRAKEREAALMGREKEFKMVRRLPATLAAANSCETVCLHRSVGRRYSQTRA